MKRETQISFYLTTIMAVFLLFFVITPVFSQHNKKHKNIMPDTLYAGVTGQSSLIFHFIKGNAYNHPSFAVWAEDSDGVFLETLFVTRSFATGIFGHGDAGDGTWKSGPGESIRPAALPYFAHKRNIISRDSLYVPTPENPVADALTGATPVNDFVLYLSPRKELSGTIFILFEINQPFDWNDYWTNNRYPGNRDYLVSAQPSVIYKAKVNLSEKGREFPLTAIGHGHFSGKNGELYPDLSTLTTALHIVDSITLTVEPKN